MSIYTKTGDAGTTSLFNGNRVPKSDIRIKACGELDELSSHIGYALPLTQDVKIRGLLLKVQKNLSRTMSIISGAKLDTKEMQKQVKLFETIIDKESSTLTKLDEFILPSGSAISAWFHILRAVCRRAERAVVECKTMKQPAFVPLSGTTAGKLSNETIDPIISYLNRLSDLFFILARVYNTDKEIFA